MARGNCNLRRNALPAFPASPAGDPEALPSESRLEEQAEFVGMRKKLSSMKILITGSTGLVGTALAQSLKNAGHTVCRLIRPGTVAESVRSSEGFDVSWNPGIGELGGAAVGADAVVNLAGAPIAAGRWTR